MASTLDQVRKLSAAMRYREAEQLLIPLLKFEPNNPALLTELAQIYCYTGREIEAVWTLDRVPSADHLRKILARHFAARIALDPNDSEAQSCLKHTGVSAKAGVKLTACLIVKNEEANLDRCLRSLKGAVHEIVVVDTGSIDSTVQIAEKYGAKIGKFDWIDDFAAARNHSISLATGHWILWIDADEELAPEARPFLKQAITRPQFGGFNAEIVNFTSEASDESKYIHQAVRLFQNRKDVRFSGRIHEQLTPAFEAAGLPWANLPGFRILHHGYRPSMMASRDKVNRTITALEKEVREAPQDPFHWFNLANAYVVGEKWKEAEHAAKMCARHAPHNYEYGALNYQFLSTALANQAKFVEALRACDEADSKGFRGLFTEFERANVLFRVGNLAKAIQAANRCCEAPWPTNSIGDRGIFDYKRWILRGQILALMDRFDEALADFDRCPNHPMSLYSKAATLEKAGRPDEALEAFLQGKDIPEISQICLKSAGRCCMTLGLPKQSASFYEKAWQANRADYESWVGWAQACETWGDLPSIVAAYEAYATTCEPTPEILINWGRALELSGEVERALTCYTEAIQRDESHANAYFNAGDLLYKLGR
ncbi:MAG TPA: glycosyltransferase, partial [Fimbriimonadaceae bacterium]|nr:glycosyltransferase [Fimbriimonadaceae bacterium]